MAQARLGGVLQLQDILRWQDQTLHITSLNYKRSVLVLSSKSALGFKEGRLWTTNLGITPIEQLAGMVEKFRLGLLEAKAKKAGIDAHTWKCGRPPADGNASDKEVAYSEDHGEGEEKGESHSGGE